MTEAQAWRWLRNKMIRQIDECYPSWICKEMDGLRWISLKLRIKMETAMEIDKGRREWFGSPTRRNTIIRADYCELQACIAETGGVK